MVVVVPLLADVTFLPGEGALLNEFTDAFDYNNDGIIAGLFNEDIDGDGNLGLVTEDLNGNGTLDTAINEDLNGNGTLDFSFFPYWRSGNRRP